MCGIFGFALKTPIAMDNVFRLLEKLEVHQYPSEPKPVGGYGAGIAVLEESGEVLCEKIGSVDGSPAKRLSEIFSVKEASILIAHVRMPSPQFMTSSSFKETAQPYIAKCQPDLTVISVHNGYIENYKEIKGKLCGKHVFESEKSGFIDSEIIPHFFEEKLLEKGDVNDALDAVFSNMEGSSAIGILQISTKGTFLHFIHKGNKTRGLTVWTNKYSEAIFCSRKEVLVGDFNKMLVQGEFEEKVSVQWREDASLKLSVTI